MNSREHLAERICQTGRLLHQRGFVAATEGNLSCRLSDDEVMCTPTMMSKGHLEPADLCVIDMVGRQVLGDRQPSSEIQLHLSIYRADPRVRAVVHSHPPHATAFAISAVPVPSGLLAEAEFFLGEIPTVAYHTPGSAELADALAPYVGRCRCAILKNHGAVSWDQDLQWAGWWMEILDAYCRSIILARHLGELSPLPGEEIDKLRKLGGTR